MKEKLLAWSYCFIFFNPLSLSNEIWPYYVVFCFTLSYKLLNLVLILGYIISASIGFIIVDGILFNDVLQALIVMQTCIYLSTLDNSQKDKICKVFEKFILISMAVGAAQFLIDHVQEYTYLFFSGRPSYADGLLLHRKVVSLLAPEPVYAAAHLLSLFLFLIYCRKSSVLICLGIIVLMLMTRAISVWLLLPVVTIFVVATKRLPVFYLLGAILILIIPVIYFQENLEKLFVRLLSFIRYVYEDFSILSAEAKLGSVRLGQIVSTSFTLFNDHYVKPFSFLGAISITTYSIGIILVVPLIFLLMLSAPIVTLTGIIILLLTGPVLLSFTVASVLLMTLEHVKVQRKCCVMQSVNKIAHTEKTG